MPRGDLQDHGTQTFILRGGREVTEPVEGLTQEQKLVVVFDICSSSKILEDLKLSDNLAALRNLLISIKKFLTDESAHRTFEVYKFIGDGWILLFAKTASGEELITFLEDLSRFFKRELARTILPRLQAAPTILGLTFGIDSGTLVRMLMMGNIEYIGRPLNIASRLQSSIKQRDRHPAYKVLFSKPSFKALGISADLRECKEVRRTLSNIQSGENYACVKMRLRV